MVWQRPETERRVITRWSLADHRKPLALTIGRHLLLVSASVAAILQPQWLSL